MVALAKISNVPSDKIFVYGGSKQSERYTTNISGLFGSARVAMSDTVFAEGADLAKGRGVVGHEKGHYALGHVFWAVLVRVPSRPWRCGWSASSIPSCVAFSATPRRSAVSPIQPGYQS